MIYLPTDNHDVVTDSSMSMVNTLKSKPAHLDALSHKMDDIAKQHCIETLLNCFYRETQTSGKYIRILNGKELEQIHATLPKELVYHPGLFMLIHLPANNVNIIIAVKHHSKIGYCRYQSAPYLHLNFSNWEKLAWNELTELLLKELAHHHQQLFNNELYKQIQNSVQIMSRVIQFNRQNNQEQESEFNFIESEQSLIFGHAFHPTPKSREGLTSQEIDHYSPELKAQFSLYYFSVRKEYIFEKSLLGKSSADIIQENAPASLHTKNNYVLICTHPWQAGYLKNLPIVKKALEKNQLYDLGQQGDFYYPTSSIRTVYHPNSPFFYKFSLNIRITNCIRKNAVYELKTAVCLTQIISTKLNKIKQNFPEFYFLLEPAYLSIDLPEGTEEERKQITEGFSVILRQNFSREQLSTSTPILAGHLFGKILTGTSIIFKKIQILAHQLNISYEAMALFWLNQYVEKIIYPVLYCHFNLGITFEPHLQNVLIGIKNNMPECIFIRDLEGTKLSKEHWPEHNFNDLEEQAKQSLYYSEQLAWNRIAYCLFVNNIGEAIFRIANGCTSLETKLWGLVRHHLSLFQEKYGNEHSKQRIHGLLSNDPLPIKCNFMTRFLKKADKESVYDYLVDHPLQEKIDQEIV